MVEGNLGRSGRIGMTGRCAITGDQPHRVGDWFLIPDIVTGFGKNGKSHPWIVRSANGWAVTLCPRTTKYSSGNKKGGILHPIDELPGFSKPGLILSWIHFTTTSKNLNRYMYLGRDTLGVFNSRSKRTEIGPGLGRKSVPRVSNPVLKPEIAEILKARIEAKPNAEME